MHNLLKVSSGDYWEFPELHDQKEVRVAHTPDGSPTKHVVTVRATGWKGGDDKPEFSYNLDDAGWETLKARLDAFAINTETGEA